MYKKGKKKILKYEMEQENKEVQCKKMRDGEVEMSGLVGFVWHNACDIENHGRKILIL